MKENQQKIRPHVIPDIEDWPIYHLSEDRKAFIREVNEFTLDQFLKNHTQKELFDILTRTNYLERIRIKEEPWKVDPPDERQFWKKIQKHLVHQSQERLAEGEAVEVDREMLYKIINRYSEEIVGTFKKKTFLFARKFLTFFFTRLLMASRAKNLFQWFGSKERLSDRMIVRGEIEIIRKLMKEGTVVIVPTHFSNLDSILVGYAIDTFVGLPSFSYGAGLNLYNTGYTAYFMNRLGAYRVDRRKKNPIYLETLKSMSSLSLQRGVNSIFFPGGTRSRSGAIETKLKLGLLSTVVQAQRSNFQNGKDDKIFIVPLILSYHFVLEARYLIEQYLRKLGKEKYLRIRDVSDSLRKILTFAWHSFSQTSDIILSFGPPMDVLGNPVDETGVSYDQFGKPVQLEEYFFSNGQLSADEQRDSEYTKILGEKILDRFYRDNIVLASHLTAFAAFELLKKHNRDLDLFRLLRLPVDEWVFNEEELTIVIEQLKVELINMEKKGQIKLSEQIFWSGYDLIREGIKHLGSYHTKKPLKFNKKKQIISESFQLLYYYHNRLENYQLDTKISLKKYAAAEAV